MLGGVRKLASAPDVAATALLLESALTEELFEFVAEHDDAPAEPT